MFCNRTQHLNRETDHRLNSVAENVTTQGFDLKVGTWSDTTVWGAGATWLAFGKGEMQSLLKSGQLINADSIPVSPASISLIKSADSSFIKATIINDKGFYQVDSIPNGKYLLKIRRSTMIFITKH